MVVERDLAERASVARTDIALGMVAFGVAMLPLSHGHGSINVAPADVGMLLAIVAAMLWAKKSGAALRAPYLLSVGIMVLAGLIAASVGSFTSAGMVAVAQDVYLLLWAIAVANVISSAVALRLILSVWSWTAIVAAGLLLFGVAAGWDALAGINPTVGSRAAFTFTDENSAGLYFALSLAVVLASRTPASKPGRVAAVLLLAGGLLVTGSLAGLLSLATICFVGAVVGAVRRFGWATAIALLGIIAIAGGGLFVAVRSTHFFDKASASNVRFLRDSLGRQEQSTGSREVIIREMEGLFLSGPIIGRGPASTRDSMEAIALPYPKEAHDDYLATITERGVLGAVGLLLLIGAVKIRARALDVRLLSADFSESLRRPVWLLGAVASLALVAFTHEILHERIVWTLLGLVAGVHAFGLRSRKPEGSEVR